MIKGGVYKKRKVDRERGEHTSIKRHKKKKNKTKQNKTTQNKTRRTLRVKRVNSNHSYVNVVSSGQFV